MGVKSHGFRCGTRSKLRKSPRERKLTVTKYLQQFKIGDYVAIVIEPSSHKGMPHPRFHGLTGRVVGKRGRAYIVQVREGSKIKTVFAYPEHLKAVKVS
jgi:large subunit ribosomal protein L21e